MKISILGCGWLGLPLGKFLVEKGFSVKGSVTRAEKFNLLSEAGIEPYQLVFSPEMLAERAASFFECDILIVNFPPKRREDIEEYHPLQIENLIEQVRKYNVGKLLFVSSTSVYPDVNREVFEEDIFEPVKGSGKALKIAEELLRREKSFQTTILRFAGLVGPERLPGRFLAGKKDVPNGAAPVNLIHRDDCIAIIYQLIAQEAWGEVFNACSDQHPSRQEFYTKAALNIGLEPPQFAREEHPSFKIINSKKLKGRLAYQFKYADPLQMLQSR